MWVVRVAACLGIWLTLMGASATGAARFGARLTNDLWADGPQIDCYRADKCTWVMMKAYRRPEGQTAPKDGYIGKIRLMACEPGTLKLQLVRTKDRYWGKSVLDGPTINYNGDKNRCEKDRYDIETFVMRDPIPVRSGDRLAIVARKQSAIVCDGEGKRTVTHNFSPPLVAGKDYRWGDFGMFCYLTIEAEYTDGPR